MLKEADKVEVRREELGALEDKQQDVLKQLEIKKMIKGEQKAELDRNI